MPAAARAGLVSTVPTYARPHQVTVEGNSKVHQVSTQTASRANYPLLYLSSVYHFASDLSLFTCLEFHQVQRHRLSPDLSSATIVPYVSNIRKSPRHDSISKVCVLHGRPPCHVSQAFRVRARAWNHYELLRITRT